MAGRPPSGGPAPAGRRSLTWGELECPCSTNTPIERFLDPTGTDDGAGTSTIRTRAGAAVLDADGSTLRSLRPGPRAIRQLGHGVTIGCAPTRRPPSAARRRHGREHPFPGSARRQGGVVSDTTEEILSRWREWLDRIREDVLHLHLNRHVWRDLVAIVRSNPAIPEPGHIMGWFAALYSTTQAIGIRRHADLDKQSITLARLLEQIRGRPDVMSRSRYLRFYHDADERERKRAHAEYDSFSGGGRDVISVTLVAADLAQLGESTKRIAKYATRLLAHLDARGIDDIPTYDDLDIALAELERLLKKYTLLLRCEALASAEPVLQYNWKSALTVPWIPPDPA